MTKTDLIKAVAKKIKGVKKGSRLLLALYGYSGKGRFRRSESLFGSAAKQSETEGQVYY